MKQFIIFCSIATWTLVLHAKQSIAMTDASAGLIHNDVFTTLFEKTIVSDEESALDTFLSKKVHFALIRKDIFELLSSKKKHRAYYIIGEVAHRSKLLFLSKKKYYKNIQRLKHQKIVVDMLSMPTDTFVKEVLKEYSMLYSVNIHSMDSYHALHALKRDEVTIAILLLSPDKAKLLKPYIRPYPQGFYGVLEKNPLLECQNHECSIKYYLIASADIGADVMHNIYTQLAPIWSTEKNLLSSIGNYYIDTSYSTPKPLEVSVKQVFSTQETTKLLHFGRTPWMDVAIHEAMLGKGSSEYVMPMLDLSYKYIRFSKGEKGITTAPNDSKTGAWCAAYICWTLDKSGYKVHQKGRMASQSFRYFKDKLYRKIQKPIFGAITLYTSMKNPQHGHVGYLFGHTKQGKNILLGGNQNNRLKFASYPARGFGSYRFNGFYVPIDYHIKPQDYLTKKDIYPSAKKLNHRYGIRKSKSSHKVR